MVYIERGDDFPKFSIDIMYWLIITCAHMFPSIHNTKVTLVKYVLVVVMDGMGLDVCIYIMDQIVEFLGGEPSVFYSHLLLPSCAMILDYKAP